ncbi:MAG TPA: TlpA disulfide reductase family protein [Terriglobales bacterium]|nr:TlpA disulfide reductase family protein [Terriglobales bacterium]
MQRPILACALALAAASLLSTAAAAQQPQPVPEVYLFKNPQPAPVLEATTLNGQHISLAALRGKVVLLNFWATWCGPCRQEIPEFEQLQRKYAGKLQVVGLSVDELPPAAVAKVAAKMGINYPVALATSAVEKRFGDLSTIPVTWVIDRNGQVDQKNHGANPYAVFDTEVRALLGLPTQIKVARIDQLSPNGKVGTIDIPGLAADLRALTPAQRQEALAKLNSQACTCGCDWSLATCRVQDPSCGFSLPQARKLIAAIKAGAKP